MTVDILTDEWYEGLASGSLLIQKCNECARLTMYPKYACPSCQSESLGWQESSGRGTLHALTVMRQSVPSGFDEDVPYALGIVFLEEGVQLLTRLVPDEDGEWSGYRLDGPLVLDAAATSSPETRPGAHFRREG